MNPWKKIFIIIFIVCLVTTLLLAITMYLNRLTDIRQEESPETVGQAMGDLPDTMYASATLLQYSVKLFDTITSGQLDTLGCLYRDVPGVFTFRGGSLRDHPHSGKLSSRPTTIVTDWEFRTDFDTTLTDFGRWGGGTGWTGQPLLVHWPDSLIQVFRQLPDTLMYQVTSAEVIFGSLCGKVYFVDFETGNSTRKPFNIQNPLKGTPGLDPALNGLLFVGHGIPRGAPMGITVFDLLSHQKKQFFPGNDPFALKRWPAFDASPVAAGQFLFWPGENGVLYKFLRTTNGMVLHSALRYHLSGKNAPGIESSMAVYRNYGFFGDNHGNILCINLNNLKPVWHYHNLDDTDASIVIEIEDGIPYLYTGCEVDKQGNSGFSQITKLNGLNGNMIWQKKIPARSITLNEKRYNGGMLSTPLFGSGNCNELIYCIVALPDSSHKSDLIAFRKSDGDLLWKLRLDAWSWSSPAPFYTQNQELVILAGDVTGNAYLIDGKTGMVIFKQQIGQNFESSPLVWGNCAIFGSRGRSIYKLTIQ